MSVTPATNAFPAAAGYANFNDIGLFPVIYSKQILFQLQRKAVVDAITNTQYEGEAREGASVKIVKAPAVNVATYARGQKINRETIQPESTELFIDQSAYFGFNVDVIEQQQSQIDLASMTLQDATYRLRDNRDANILSYINTNAGTDLGAVTIGQATGETTPLNLMGTFRRKLYEANVPLEDTWLVISPQFLEYLLAEDSKFTTANEMGTGKSQILDNNGLAFSLMPHMFKVYLSNNLPTGQIIAGHKAAVATATTVSESRVLDNPDSFGKMYDGLLVWGRQVLRTDNLVKATVTYGTK